MFYISVLRSNHVRGLSQDIYATHVDNFLIKIRINVKELQLKSIKEKIYKISSMSYNYFSLEKIIET